MTQYFCHTCNTRIDRVDANFTCPNCSGGFVEEMEDIQSGASSGLNFTSGFDFGGRGGQVNPLSFLQFILEPGLQRGSPVGRGRGTGGPASQLPGASSSFGAPAATSDPADRSASQADPAGRQAFRGPQQFSFVIDGRPGGASGGVPGDPANAEHILVSFLNDLLHSLGGGAGAQVHIGAGLPLNLGDYVWGRDGLDAIVTQLMNNMEGTGPPPLNEERLATLNEVEIVQSQVDAKLQCSVCWEDFKLDEKVIKLDCEHIYHSDCILPWLKLHGTCPVCRKDLNDLNEKSSSREQEGQSGQAGNSSSASDTTASGNMSGRSSSRPRFDDDMEFD